MTRMPLVIVGVLGALAVVTPVTVSAQINPYRPPFPDAVIVQPCGMEPQWVPSTHPLAQQTPRICQPPTIPDPTQPWTLEADVPFALGGVYRNPYGMVVQIVRIQQRLVWSVEDQRFVTLGDGDALWWASVDVYYQGSPGRIVPFDGTQPRGNWWSIDPRP